jgi:hypothetical protein
MIHIAITAAVLGDPRNASLIDGALTQAHADISRQTLQGTAVLAVDLDDEAYVRPFLAVLETNKIPYLLRTPDRLTAFSDNDVASVRCDVHGNPVAGMVMAGGRPMANSDDVMALTRYSSLAEAALRHKPAPTSGRIGRTP